MKHRRQNPTARACGITALALGTALTATAGAIVSEIFRQRTDTSPDYLIVLGARVHGSRPGTILESRIRAAAEFLQAHPEAMAVLSGGFPGSSQISEAECMERELISRGIQKERLIREERSRTTEENLIYSLMLIPEGATVTLLTSDFHLFRARRHAIRNRKNVPMHAVPCPKNDLPLAFMREQIAVFVEFFLGKL